MSTTTDLRDLLVERADEASTGYPPVEAAIRAGRHIRLRRRVVAGAGALGVAAVIVVPSLAGWPVAGRVPSEPQTSVPTDGRVTSASGFVWSPTIPGLDLPAGEPLQVPYAFGTKVVAGSDEYELGGVVRRLLQVPEGLVAQVDAAPTPSGSNPPRPPVRIVLLKGGSAAPILLDQGYLGSLAASAPESGPTRVAWTWTDVGPDADPKEVRAVDLGSDDAPTRLPLQASAWVWNFDGRDPVLEIDKDGRTFARWDVEAGALVPLTADHSAMIAMTRDRQLVLRFDEETQCTSGAAADDPGNALWERCDVLIQTLSPDGKLGLGALYADGRIDHTADKMIAIDLATGADATAFDLPPSGGAEYGTPREPAINWFVESWEPTGSAIVVVSYEGLPGDDPDSNFAPRMHTVVRCSVTSGACERVQDPIEVVSTQT